MTAAAPLPVEAKELETTRSITRVGKAGGTSWGVHLALVVLMLVWLIPTIGLLVNSFRPAQEVASSGWWNGLLPPYDLSLDNYAHVIGQNGIGASFINSLFITIPATIIPIFVAAFAAYAFSWMNFPGRNILFVVVIGLLVVPLQTTFIPILTMFAGIKIHIGPINVDGLNGQFLALWLAHTGYGLPFAVYLLRNFMGSLPREVFESAAICLHLADLYPDAALGAPLGSAGELDLRHPGIGIDELALAFVLGAKCAHHVDAADVVFLAHPLGPSIDDLRRRWLARDLTMGRTDERLRRVPEIDVDDIRARAGAGKVGLQLEGTVRRPALFDTAGSGTIDGRHADATV